ncbi:MAG: M15 family metallopeptidase [Patescibacteria group bacterium]
MSEPHLTNKKGSVSAPLVVALVIVGVAGAGILFFQLTNTKSALSQAVKSKNELQTQFSAKEEENRVLSEALYSEQQKNKDLEEDLDDVEDEVNMFEKLSRLDPELLQKYSKVFFLNEHYKPADFTVIDSKYRYPEDEALSVHKRVWPFLEDLLEEAKDDKIDLRIASAFRSFSEQTSLKSQYSVVYGAGSANQFSADQGYSEHQLGTTVDFTTVATGGALDGFNTTPTYKWLLSNAYKYGFVLSYPEGNAYYVFEPWHWRFVGKDLAADLRKKKIGFYDMDQRDIDEYLISIFDK